MLENMGQIIFKNNLLILLIFFLVGLVVHIKSFQLVPYGDDWKFIYNYYTHEEKSLHISNFPGIFAYLAPYGPSILTIGLTYDLFKNTYFIYYLIPLIFKALTAFLLFLTLKNIAKSHNQNNDFTSFLPTTLFIVSITAIQAIDWAMNTYVYIALSFFTLGLFFYSKYYISLKSLDLILGFLLFIFSIIFAPTRFTPLILILPLIDLVMVINKRDKLFTRLTILKNAIFFILAYIFLQIGIFGVPGQLNNTGRIQEFINGATADPHLSFVTFMHWIGVTIIPIYPSSGLNMTPLVGALFLGGTIWAFYNASLQKRSDVIASDYKSKNEWLIIGSLIFFMTLGIMWIISPLKPTDSADRYLVVPFFGICFLIGLLFIFLQKLKKVLIITILVLFVLQIYWVDKIYSTWISNGRGRDFIIPTEKMIMSHFPTPITEPKYIFLDFDDGAVQQSVEFGLGFRVAFLSGTRNINLVPTSFSNKDSLIKAINNEINQGSSKEKVLSNISAFQYRKRVFTDITTTFQEEIRGKVGTL